LVVGIDTRTASLIGGAAWWEVLRHQQSSFPGGGEHSMPYR
jgi:hypothetical protein